jgi:hypothetical protein
MRYWAKGARRTAGDSSLVVRSIVWYIGKDAARERYRVKLEAVVCCCEVSNALGEARRLHVQMPTRLAGRLWYRKTATCVARDRNKYLKSQTTEIASVMRVNEHTGIAYQFSISASAEADMALKQFLRARSYWCPIHPIMYQHIIHGCKMPIFKPPQPQSL